jgi:DNA-binding transcriptional regulator YiaG
MKKGGGGVSTFEDEVEAYKRAQGVSELAESMKNDLLHAVVYNAKKLGMSIRNTARLLNVPQSTIFRFWKNGRTRQDLPLHGSKSLYVQVSSIIYAKSFDLRSGRCPWEWNSKADGSLEVATISPDRTCFQKGEEVEPSTVEERQPSMGEAEHDSAEFFALRKRMGLTRRFLERYLDLDAGIVKRWEDPMDASMPTDEAWDGLREMFEAFKDRVVASVQQINETIAPGEGTVTITIYREQQQFTQQTGREDCYETGNAENYQIAMILEVEGYHVAFR